MWGRVARGAAPRPDAFRPRLPSATANLRTALRPRRVEERVLADRPLACRPGAVEADRRPAARQGADHVSRLGEDDLAPLEIDGNRRSTRAERARPIEEVEVDALVRPELAAERDGEQ